MPNWKECLNFTSPKTVESPVLGKIQVFYPLSIKSIPKMIDLVGSASKSIAMIFETYNRKSDQGWIDRKWQDSENPGTMFEQKPIAPELAQMRFEQSNVAFKELLDVLKKPESLKIVAQLAMESLKEIFPPGATSNPTIEEFQEETPLSAIGDLVLGMYEANKDCFSPLTKGFQDKIKQMTTDLKASLSTISLEGKQPSEPESSEPGKNQADGESSNPDKQPPTLN